MMNNLRYGFLGLFALMLMFTSCDDDEGTIASGVLQLTFNGITQPGEGYLYGVWLKESGLYNPIGDFTINDQGLLTQSIFRIEEGRLAAADGVLITFEAEDGIGSSPGPNRLMAGDFVNKGAVLTAESVDALDIDFELVSGSYILSSPTDTVQTNEESGIWFYDTVAMTSTLDFPALDDFWTYEAWMVIDDTTLLSMGTFSDSQSPTPNVYGSSLPGYAAPGQDFLMGDPTLPANLIGKRMFISMEPVPDDDVDRAFGIRPFSNEIKASEDGMPVDLEYVDIGMPRGLATRG